MGVNLKQLADGSFGVEGQDLDAGPFVYATAEWNASSVDKTFFVAPRSLVVQRIQGRVTVAGTDGSAVTAVVRKVASGTAIASGNLLHSSSLNLKGTADTNLTALTLTTTLADLRLAQGDAIAIDFTGTMTAATGCVTVAMTVA